MRGWREGGNGDLVFNGDRASVVQDEEFWGWVMMMVAHECEFT